GHAWVAHRDDRGRVRPRGGLVNILALDASTYTGTVAVLRDGAVVAAGETAMRGARVERLMPAVADVLGAAGLVPGDIDLVVCGAGPGSFTSLRIAASIAKGIALGRAIPLVAVSSLVLIVAGLEPLPAPGRYLAVIDALRGEAYAQLVEVLTDPASVVLVGEPTLVANGDLAATARGLGAVTVGAGGEIPGIPHARGVARLSTANRRIDGVNLATWEPSYGRLAEAQVRWEVVHGQPLLPR
ncbi:MAG: tRNA (adenosine(37)-N6)-threonylcarbamoyltransferase complex dimerization subunit type 1 TsaB, partial [Gemmatimonadaceae bacterium]